MQLDENQLLNEILTRFGTVADALSFGFDEVQHWPSGLLNILEESKLLVKDVPAQSLQCDGCEHGCFMPVVFTEDARRVFIVCDHPEQQNYMGRIAVNLSRLNQWLLTTKQMASVIAKLLDFDTKPQYQNKTADYTLGMLKGKKGRRSVVLAVNPLSIVINQRALPVDELLYIEASKLLIDVVRIHDALNAYPPSNGKSYTSNTDKREAGKFLTQAMYADWQDEYKKLKHENSNQSDTWIAKQISKMGIAKGKSPNTIRKNMKK